jgi:hypothetical protein
MKKAITIALLAAMSAMMVSGFVSTLATQQAYAATSSTSGAFRILGQEGSTSAGATGSLRADAGSGLGAETSGCFALIGSCASGEDPEER